MKSTQANIIYVADDAEPQISVDLIRNLIDLMTVIKKIFYGKFLLTIKFKGLTKDS